VVRDGAGTIRAFHNVCRHRGSLVVPEATGTRSAFQCGYHHWTYGLDGSLIAVPGEAAYKGTGFERQDFGLVPIRVDQAFGLVFACLDPLAPSLGDFLGPELLSVLEEPLGRASYEVF